MLSHTQRVHTARLCSSRGKLVVRCSGNGSGAAVTEGARVKVTQPVKIYHAPKHPQGLQLEGMEGTVVKDVTQYKGEVLSANFPYKVEFKIEADGKPAKFQVHLGEEELQVL